MSGRRSKLLVLNTRRETSTQGPPDQQNYLELEITARQLEILSWVERGKSATDIGGILGISHRTVEHHLEKACNNLGVRTRFQAVLKVRDLGLIGRADP